MPESTHHNNIPNRDMLLKYLRGELSPSEQHRIEKMIHENPMVRDALEGLEELDTQRFREDLDQLSSDIKSYTAVKTNRKIPLLRIAAVFIFMVIAGGIIYLSISTLNTENQKQELSLNQPERLDIAGEKDMPGSDTAKEISHPAEPVTEEEETSAPASGRNTDMKTDDQIVEKITRQEDQSGAGAKPSPEPVSSVSTLPGDEELVDMMEDETFIEDIEGDELFDEAVERSEYERDALIEPEAVQEPAQFNEEIGMKAIQGNISQEDYEKKKKRSTQHPVAIRLDPLETTPRPVTGFDRLHDYLQDSLQYPSAARKNGIEGNVILSFSIDEDSIPENITINRSLGYGCDEEAIRLIREGPNWIPYQMNGKIMEKQVTLSIEFIMDEE